MSRVPFRTRTLKKGGYAKRAIVDDWLKAQDQEELLVDFEMSHTPHEYEGVCPDVSTPQGADYDV